MIDGPARADARIRQIRALLGEPPETNEAFGSELHRVAARMGGPLGTRTPPEALHEIIQDAAGQTGLPEALISAVMAAESGFRADAVSSAGAQGLMQLMPGTARGLGVSDPFDPRQNVLAGSEYLRRQVEQFGSIERGLAAYNAGPGAVRKYGGIPPYAETQNYVRRVLDLFHQNATQKRE